MKRIYPLLLLLVSFYAKAQQETEPNNTFATANSTNVNDVRTGTVNSPNDALDYFMTVLPVDGTMKIYVQGTNTGTGAGYLYMYGYDRRKANGQVFSEYINTSNTAAGATIRDTITVYGRAADTFYFRVEANQPFTYNFRYEMVDLSENDAEPNNTINEPVTIAYKEEKKGHIGYLFNGTSDGDDYYRAVLPSDGTLKVYVKGINRGEGAGYLYMYGYDRRKLNGQVFSEYIVSSNTAAGAAISDTITAYGRAADTFYFRVISAQAFSYSVSYEMVDLSENDAEPNNTIDESISIAHKEEKKGHVGYLFNGTDDTYDYYKTVLPTDGTLKVYVKGTNRGDGAGYLYMYGYDRRKLNGQIFSDYIVSSNTAAGATIMDTLTTYGRAADTFYFRVQSAKAFEYSFSYEMVDTSQNDAEPNNTFETPVSIAHMEQKKGHIGYLFNGTEDTYDYYKTVFPSDGTLKVYVKGTNRGDGAGYLYMYGYDRRKASGQVLSAYIASSNTAAGATIYDTLTLQCVAPDTFYFRIQSSKAFTYEFKYEVTLGRDTLVKVCPGYTTNISGLYNTSPFSTVKYENMATPGTGISPNNVGAGVYRLSVYNGTECTRDTAFITVGLNPKPNLGLDTTVRKCIGFTADIRTAKDTTGYALVQWSTPTPQAVEPGIYTLIVTNEFGCKDTAVITVENYAQPLASYTINSTPQCLKGNSFTFTNTSTISTGTSTYQWNFGDNSTASGINAQHAYAAAGTYNVKLVATSNNGCKDSITKAVTINASPALGADQTVNLNCIGTTNITSLYNTNGYTNVEYSTSTPTAVLPGTYTLIVTNATGCKDTAVITVVAQPVTVVPSAGANTKTATRECTDGTGWTHYYNDNGTATNFSDDILVLSLKKNGNNIGVPGDGTFQLKTAAIAAAGSNTGTLIMDTALINVKYWAMNRYWQLMPTRQPSSNVGVRFYYTTQDLADINGSHPSPNINHEDLMLYKVSDRNPDPSTNLAGTSPVTRLTYGTQPTTSTFTYNTINTNMYYAEFEVTSFSGGGAGVPDYLQPLPLKLLTFSALLKGDAVNLDWKTAREVNTSHFNVQRSTDGSSFKNIGATPASGLSAAIYSFTDRNALSMGVSKIYYRLEVADKDGKVFYSAVTVINVNTKNLFSISPNPASSIVYVKGNNIQQVQIMDNSGRVVLTENVNNENVHQLSINHLAKGLYIIKMKDKDGSIHTEKLIIQ